MYATLITSFLTFQNQIRLYHWSTTKYSRHIASDEIYKSIDTLIDRFVETLQGKVGRVNYRKMVITLRSMDDGMIVKEMTQFRNFLEKEVEKCLKEMPSPDLITIRDEMLEAVNRTIYLFTLK